MAIYSSVETFAASLTILSKMSFFCYVNAHKKYSPSLGRLHFFKSAGFIVTISFKICKTQNSDFILCALPTSPVSAQRRRPLGYHQKIGPNSSTFIFRPSQTSWKPTGRPDLRSTIPGVDRTSRVEKTKRWAQKVDRTSEWDFGAAGEVRVGEISEKGRRRARKCQK